jgi:hypothetical protein
LNHHFHFHIEENIDIFGLKFLVLLHRMFHQAIEEDFFQILNLIVFQFVCKIHRMNVQKDHEEWIILDHQWMLEEILVHIYELY